MEGGAGGEKSNEKENEEKLKTGGLKTQEKDKGKLREKVNFIARNREAAAGGGGGRGKQGQIQRKARSPGEPDAPRQVIPSQPKASLEFNKPQMTGAGASKMTSKETNCRPSKLTSTSKATNKVPSRSTSTSLSERPHSSQSKASKRETSLQKSRPQTSRLQAERPKLQIGGKPPRRVKDENESDLVTGMIERNLHHLLSQIFLQQVCKFHN